MKRTWGAIILIFLLYPLEGFGQDTKENADFKLAVNLYNDKLYDLAVEQFRQFVAAYPNTQQGIEARFFLGLCQSKLGKHDEARLTFQNFALAFPEHPKAPEAWWSVAEAYSALDNLREAALAFERVKTFHPRSKLAPNALAKSAEYFERAGDRESAKKVLRTLVQDYASADVVGAARLTLARMYLSDNQSELARAEGRRILDGSKDPELKAQASVLMSEALAQLGKYEEAQGVLGEIVRDFRLTSSYHAALLLLGSLQRDLGNVVEAQGSWRTVTEDSTRSPASLRQKAFVNLGDLYLLKGEYARALDAYDRAAGIRESLRGIAAYRAGATALKLGSFARANQLLTSVLEDTSLTINRDVVWLKCAQAAEGARSYADALKLFQTARDRSRSDQLAASALFGAARIYQEHLNDHRTAVSLFESLVRDHPTSPLVDDAMFFAAESQQRLGSLEASLQTYESLKQRFPSSEYAGRARAASERIRLFDLKDKEAGLEKLALLVGDVIAQQSKGDLAFRLAEIYFHDLKDYERASVQYSVALQAPLTQSRQAAAWYYQAKSYEYQALRGRLESNAGKSGEVGRAIASYDSLVRRFPSSEFAEEAMIAALRLRLQQAGTVSAVRTTGIEFLTAHPSVRRKDLVHYSLAEAYRAVKAFEDAAMTYEWTLKSQPSAEITPDALYHLGESLLAIGARDTAAIVLEGYLARFPNHEFSARSAATLADFYAKKGNAVQAVKWYQAIEQSYSYSDANRGLNSARGDAYYQAGDYANAIEAYELSLRETGGDFVDRSGVPAKVLFSLASSYQQTGARQKAKRFFAEYLMRDQSSEKAGQAFYALASIARDEKYVTLVARYLEEASHRSAPSSGGVNRAALEAADLYFRTEDFNSAIAGYSELARQATSDTVQQYLQSRIVVCYFRLNNTKEADARAAAFVKRFPGLARYAAEFEYERGMYSVRRDDLTGAKRYFDNVLQKYANTPFVPQAMLGNARVAELTEKSQEAIRLYEAILQRYPNDHAAPRAQLSLGNLYYAQEKWDMAARQYKTIVDNESRAPDLLRYGINNLILAYKELSLFDAALELTRKYIEKFPDDPELMNKRVDIGVIYQRLGYYDQAVVHLQSLLENADSDLEAEVRYYIGEAYFHKGDYQQAILEFLKVPYLVTKRTKNDWVATSYYMAGQSYEKMSKFDQAITMYRQIMERSGVDATFKTGAQREIDRVNALLRSNK